MPLLERYSSVIFSITPLLFIPVRLVKRIIMEMVYGNRQVVGRVKKARIDVAFSVGPEPLRMGPLERARWPLEAALHGTHPQ